MVKSNQNNDSAVLMREAVLMKSFICLILSFLQVCIFNIVKIGKTQTIGVNKYMEYQTFEGFGTSSAWWSQNIDDEKRADEIARLLYDKETGLGLRTYRYNIGAGEKENPDSRIGDVARRAESFYVFDENTGKWEYDFTRDANAVRMMKLAVKYGAEEVILFCNSPHYSMTVSGHASGGFEKMENNLPPERYKDFAEYVLTIADYFFSQGIPVKAISPINEPQWDWGGEWVGQEGCHFDVKECIDLLETFALMMKERKSPYELRGPESGQLTEDYYEYIDSFMQSKTLREFCSYYSGHSYWMDGNIEAKRNTGNRFREMYPDMKFEMSEWCEMPLTIDSTTIESGLYMANVIIQDLTLLGAVSWSSWTAVNGDGLLDITDGNLVKYGRYTAYSHFTKFIKPGSVRIDVMNSKEDGSVSCVAFRNGSETVCVLVNNSAESAKLNLTGLGGKYEIYLSDKDRTCQKTEEGSFLHGTVMPPMSIETIIVNQ